MTYDSENIEDMISILKSLDINIPHIIIKMVHAL